MGVQNAWKRGYTGAGIKVAVVDDGVQADHTDLDDNVARIISNVQSNVNRPVNAITESDCFFAKRGVN